MNGAESLVRTLIASGVEVCFANPGTSEMHFVSALDRTGAGGGMRCVLGLFEGVVTGAADGYYRMAGKPAATLLHLGPGLANGMANLHNAKKARSGIVNIVGEHATHHRQYDAPLTTDIEAIARPMSHWVHTAQNARAVAGDGARAIEAALSAPGQIATLILPADTAWNEADGPAVARAPAARPVACDAAIAAAVRALRQPNAGLLLGGPGLRADALQWAGRIAAATGCTLFAEFAAARIERGAGRVMVQRLPYAVDAAVAVLAPMRQIVLAGAQPPVSFFAYPGKPSLQAPPECVFTELAGLGDDLAASLEALADALGARTLAPAHVASLDLPALPEGQPTVEGIAAVLAALLPEDAIVIDEAVSTGRGFPALTRTARPHDWLTLVGGSIGWALPQAVGAAIACPQRKVIALESDGSGMYTPQALWTMAREQLDVTVLVFANRAYNILRGELAGVGGGPPGPRATDMLTLDRPVIDWAGLARSQGVPATRATDLVELAVQLSAAFAQRGPVLVELVI